jgi:hypothetical protein
MNCSNGSGGEPPIAKLAEGGKTAKQKFYRAKQKFY